MYNHNVVLKLHGRMNGVALASAFARSIEEHFAAGDRSTPRFELGRVGGDRVDAVDGTASEELVGAFFGKIPRYHDASLAYVLPIAERTYVRIVLVVSGENTRQNEADGEDACIDFNLHDDWTDGGGTLSSGRMLAPEDVIAISTRMIETVLPETAYLSLPEEQVFPPSCFLRFHRDAGFFSRDLRQILRIAENGDKDEGSNNYFKCMGEAASEYGRKAEYEAFEKVFRRAAPLTEDDWWRIRGTHGSDVRNALANCPSIRFTETAAGMTVFSTPLLRSHLDELYARLARRALGS